MSGLADMAQRVRNGKITAVAQTRSVLANIAAHNETYTAFTRTLPEQALANAARIDADISKGHDPGPLAGVPFAVKDLFDVAGLPTTAGAQMRLNAQPAIQDAGAVARLKAAGAVLVGTLNMDEYAYGFATVNAHFGTTRNPHDLARLAGGSSGGSAAAVAAGLVPLTLGSDTNGSIRVPASLCGVWGMRPGDGAIPLQGVFPFVASLDTVGPLAPSLADLRLSYEILSGEKPTTGGPRLRVARLGGFFAKSASSEALAAVDAVMQTLNSEAIAHVPEAEAARSAAFLITAAEGGSFHLDRLRTQAMEYDPAVRDRLLAGCLLPSAVLVKAQAFRAHYRAAIDALFEQFDVLLAPSTPVTAPRIDEGTIVMDGKPVSARANLGIYCQALSLAGIPVVSAPLRTKGLPIGVQFAVRRGNEGRLFALLARLERDGILGRAV